MSLTNIPQELLQNIGLNLEDRDLVSLRASCRSAAASIDARPAHFWMYRFRDVYDLPRSNLSLDGLRDLYQSRRRALRSPPLFKYGTTLAEKACLQHLLSLALDAKPSAHTVYGVPSSKNFEILDNVLQTTNILNCIFERAATSSPPPMHSRTSKTTKARKDPIIIKNNINALQGFQLLMSSRALSFHVPNPVVLSFEESQRAAYMDFESTPLLSGPTGLEVNMLWCLHVVNFFRYHMLREGEATLCPAFRDLSRMSEGTEMPQLWKTQLTNNDASVQLGRNWKGSYAYLLRKEVNELRRGAGVGQRVYEDHNVDLGEKAIQEMMIRFPRSGIDLIWPEDFEYHLKGQTFLSAAAAKMQHQPQTPRTRNSAPTIGPEHPENLKSQYFEVNGWDDETFYASGWVNQLPTQKGFPGFKRIVMMKYFVTPAGGIDRHALWAYEGVVLPGDQIIVGRWWSPEAPIQLRRVYSGPFILWNTDCAAKYHEVHEALLEQHIRDTIDITQV